MSTFALGTLALLATVAFGAQEAGAAGLFNLHGLVIVVGGTIAVLVATAQPRLLRRVARDAVRLVTGRSKVPETRGLVLSLAKDGRRVGPGLHPLIDHARALWEQGVQETMVEDLLLAKVAELRQDGVKAIAVVKNLAKYTPALGMTGTVVGLVSLFSNLGANGKDSLGPALALAMTATFYGLVLANAFVLPLADRLEAIEEERADATDALLQALVLVCRDEPLDVLSAGEAMHANAG